MKERKQGQSREGRSGMRKEEGVGRKGEKGAYSNDH